MEEVLIGVISAFTLAVFGAGGVGIWAKKRNGNGNGSGEYIRLLRSIDATLQEMRLDFARLEGRLSVDK